ALCLHEKFVPDFCCYCFFNESVTTSCLVRLFPLFISGLLILGFYAPGHAQTAVQIVPPSFSVQRGFYSAPFVLRLETSAPTARIRYTLDGSAPTATYGIEYHGPFRIDTTTVVRAIAYRPDGAITPSRSIAHSYIFVDHVRQQQGIPLGYPTQWWQYPADYEMDPEIVNDPAYHDEMDDALLAIPSVSLAFSSPDFFDPESGIYQNSREYGPTWERTVSAELIYPEGRPGFQINAGVRIQGGASRKARSSPKHSLRLLFRQRYGAGKLTFPLFNDSVNERDATNEFDALVLRSHYNHSWIHRSNEERSGALYVRDEWARVAQRAMGQISPHGQYVHLYLNGLYWGLYILHERPTARFAADYLGGEKEQYDVMKVAETVDGESAAWSKMMSYERANLAKDSVYQEFQQIANVANQAQAFTSLVGMLRSRFIGLRPTLCAPISITTPRTSFIGSLETTSFGCCWRTASMNTSTTMELYHRLPRLSGCVSLATSSNKPSLLNLLAGAITVVICIHIDLPPLSYTLATTIGINNAIG
ncbi:chitobiase/beta-hexosaminidase C-terminal domain-containing protein, partial [Chloroflexi bacterium TSY]|nr:chitobiase/beta-hexosaminidase C-terminal domain-containing protein [Chloroflexi bacterium TSY]